MEGARTAERVFCKDALCCFFFWGRHGKVNYNKLRFPTVMRTRGRLTEQAGTPD